MIVLMPSENVSTTPSFHGMSGSCTLKSQSPSQVLSHPTRRLSAPYTTMSSFEKSFDYNYSFAIGFKLDLNLARLRDELECCKACGVTCLGSNTLALSSN